MDAVDFDPDEVDEEGLPLVYNEDRINAFWSARLGELAGRWATFAGISAPWLTRLATAVVRGTLERDRAALARDAVDNLEKLGPTYVKLGQILSIRYVWGRKRGGRRVGVRERREDEEHWPLDEKWICTFCLCVLSYVTSFSRMPYCRISEILFFNNNGYVRGPILKLSIAYIQKGST